MARRLGGQHRTDPKAQDDAATELAAYRESIEIRKKLVRKDPDNNRWQRSLSVPEDRVGDILRAQGDLAGALAAYQESMAISKKLADKDSQNIIWQRDLSVSHDKIGDVLRDKDDLAGALAAYRASLAVRRALLLKDAENIQSQRDVAYNLRVISGIELETGQLQAALADDEGWLAACRKVLAQLPSASAKSDLVDALGSVSFELLFNHRPADALARAEEALGLDPTALWIETSRAHALLFLGRVADAKAVYLENKDKPIGKQTFAAAVKQDFVEFRKYGIGLPAMKEVESLL